MICVVGMYTYFFAEHVICIFRCGEQHSPVSNSKGDGFCSCHAHSCMPFAYSGVVSNIGQYPMGKGDAYSFLSTGPLCRYATDLLPMFKLIALDEHKAKLRLDEQVNRHIHWLSSLY